MSRYDGTKERPRRMGQVTVVSAGRNGDLKVSGSLTMPGEVAVSMLILMTTYGYFWRGTATNLKSVKSDSVLVRV